ncbi:MAG: type II secretion system F family protein [Syntrophomonadaceae bacterium]|nr:type II secretion system F family protein [Syntrophomonadaceae bacterium]
MDNLSYLIIVVAALAATFAALGVFRVVFRERLAVAERLEHYTVDKKSEHGVFEELNLPFSERVLKPIWNSFIGNVKQAVPKEKAMSYDRKLMLAGYPHGMDTQTFVILKYAVLMIMILLGLLTKSFMWLLVLGAIGVVAPDIYLIMCRAERAERVSKSLPDTLDLLSVSVEAGLGFDAALQKITEKMTGPLAEEFAAALNEIKVGKPRREAMRDLADRLQVDDVSTFVASLVQAESLGVPIANVLRVQSEQVRLRRRQRAEEKAHKAPIKMLLPMLFFIFPAIFIVLLGPAAIELMKVFAPGGPGLGG